MACSLARVRPGTGELAGSGLGGDTRRPRAKEHDDPRGRLLCVLRFLPRVGSGDAPTKRMQEN